jgi:hypothetical protein
LTCATLLVLTPGCSRDPAEASAQIVVTDGSGDLHLGAAKASAWGDRKTTLTDSELREQYAYGQEAQRRREEAAADEAARQKLRRDREAEATRRRGEEQDEEDPAREELRDEERRKDEERRQRFNSPRSPGSPTDALRAQQPSFDETTREIQQRQEKELDEKLLRHNWFVTSELPPRSGVSPP